MYLRTALLVQEILPGTLMKRDIAPQDAETTHSGPQGRNLTPVACTCNSLPQSLGNRRATLYLVCEQRVYKITTHQNNAERLKMGLHFSLLINKSDTRLLV